MLRMIREFREFVRALFPASPVPVPTVTVVSPLKTFRYTTYASNTKKVMGGGSVAAPDEGSALRMIYTLAGERVQFDGGARYRSHGNETFTRIDRVTRNVAGQRKSARTRATENGGGTVGE